jgi:hypothetical protein
MSGKRHEVGKCSDGLRLLDMKAGDLLSKYLGLLCLVPRVPGGPSDGLESSHQCYVKDPEFDSVGGGDHIVEQ